MLHHNLFVRIIEVNISYKNQYIRTPSMRFILNAKVTPVQNQSQVSLYRKEWMPMKDKHLQH